MPLSLATIGGRGASFFGGTAGGSGTPPPVAAEESDTVLDEGAAADDAAAGAAVPSLSLRRCANRSTLGFLRPRGGAPVAAGPLRREKRPKDGAAA